MPAQLHVHLTSRNVFFLSVGGSGFGVITKLQTAVIQSPEPPEGSNRKFCMVRIWWETEDDAARMEFLDAFQEFLYENPDSNKFGGGGVLTPGGHQVTGIFLGSMEEFGDLFSRSGLFEHLDEGLTSMPEYESLYSKDYNFIPAPEGMPDHGVLAFEFSSYGEAIIFKTRLAGARADSPGNRVVDTPSVHRPPHEKFKGKALDEHRSTQSGGELELFLLSKAKRLNVRSRPRRNRAGQMRRNLCF